MKRQGRYTKKPSLKARVRYGSTGRFGWWKQLSWKRRIALVAIPVVGLLILIPLLTYAYYAQDISDPERLMNRNQTGIVLMDKNGEEFYRTGTAEDRELIPLTQISPNVKNALLASEDKDFYKHGGVSVRGLLAAMYANIANRDATAYGGSTLTQQLVKNTLLSNNKSFLRKYQELFMSIAVERRYSKDEILAMYLNSVYFGENAFGIEEAAAVFFNKKPADLTVAEASTLIGILPAPSAYSPVSGDPAKTEVQQDRVLKLMTENGYITQAERQQADETQLSYAPPKEEEESVAPHFALMVIDELNEKYGEETVIRSGFRVKTSLDLSWQKQAQSIVAAQTVINARSGGNDAALVAIDPKTGEIRALVGSPDWNNPEFGKLNAATNSRQPGSSFKPIYFTEALSQKLITPATIIKDEATTFGAYKPNNYDFRFRGNITVRNALSQSLNIPAVKVMEKLGVDEALDTAKKLGISTLDTDTDYGLSLALGAGEVTPLEMTNAYAAFANQGKQYAATTLNSVDNKFNKNIYTHKASAKQVMSSEASFLISDILSDNTARAPTFGSSLNTTRDTAVKTGSTDDNRDAWTIGFTPGVAVGVWVGNANNEIMSSGGSGMAGPIWRKSIEAFFKDLNDEKFVQPSSVSQVSVCAGTEKRALYAGSNTTKEYFITGTIPTATCNSTDSTRNETVTPPRSESGDTTEDTTNNSGGNGNGNGNTDDEEEPQTPVTEPEEPTTDPEEPTDPTEPTIPPITPGGGTTTPVTPGTGNGRTNG